jgi:hypothetical protein
MKKRTREKGKNGLFACPCCGYATITEVAGYDICPICFWEDDGQDDPNENEKYGGPNLISLNQARINYLRNGSAEIKDKPHVRSPKEDDERLRIYILQNGKIKRNK